MSVHKIKKGPYYYADYYDFNGVGERRASVSRLVTNPCTRHHTKTPYLRTEFYNPYSFRFIV